MAAVEEFTFIPFKVRTAGNAEKRLMVYLIRNYIQIKIICTYLNNLDISAQLLLETLIRDCMNLFTYSKLLEGMSVDACAYQCFSE